MDLGQPNDGNLFGLVERWAATEPTRGNAARGHIDAALHHFGGESPSRAMHGDSIYTWISGVTQSATPVQVAATEISSCRTFGLPTPDSPTILELATAAMSHDWTSRSLDPKRISDRDHSLLYTATSPRSPERWATLRHAFRMYPPVALPANELRLIERYERVAQNTLGIAAGETAAVVQVIEQIRAGVAPQDAKVAVLEIEFVPGLAPTELAARTQRFLAGEAQDGDRDKLLELAVSVLVQSSTQLDHPMKFGTPIRSRRQALTVAPEIYDFVATHGNQDHRDIILSIAAMSGDLPRSAIESVAARNRASGILNGDTTSAENLERAKYAEVALTIWDHFNKAS